MILTSIDIGSTWTKGAAFALDRAGMLWLLAREERPTTVNDLSVGFFQVYDALNHVGFSDHLYYSSSARGGLSVAALGIVPEITSEMARIAAYSAGAKLSQAFSYRLTAADIIALEQEPPDILLFAGGTDGGHTDCVLHSAAVLAASRLSCPIVYAGNRAIQDNVIQLLEGRDVTVVDNLLPTLDTPNPEPARKAIRSIFLNSIVEGKGLDVIIESTGEEPTPTPYSIYEYCHHIQRHVPEWDEFMLIDLGGATTDVYSCHHEKPMSGTVRRGLPEPLVKRTVEGDLGLRVSAKAAASTGKQTIQRALASAQHSPEAFGQHLERVSHRPESLPSDNVSQDFDDVLAGTCVAHAVSRHAGRLHQVSTVDGLVNVQGGRDLSRIRRVIGSGGYLSQVSRFNPNPWLAELMVDDSGRQILAPRNVELLRDEHYLFPLLANIARGYPEAAALAGVSYLHSNIDTAA